MQMNEGHSNSNIVHIVHACNYGIHEEVKICLYLEDACHRLIQKHLSSHFVHKNIMTEGFSCFFVQVWNLVSSIKGKI